MGIYHYWTCFSPRRRHQMHVCQSSAGYAKAREPFGFPAAEQGQLRSLSCEPCVMDSRQGSTYIAYHTILYIYTYAYTRIYIYIYYTCVHIMHRCWHVVSHCCLFRSVHGQYKQLYICYHTTMCAYIYIYVRILFEGSHSAWFKGKPQRNTTQPPSVTHTHMYIYIYRDTVS